MSGNKKEFGDYQTPIDFCNKVCSYLDEQDFTRDVEAIIEPTCGFGNFIVAAADTFNLPAWGIDINKEYIQTARNRLPSGTFIQDNIFNICVSNVCKHKNVLVIGTPPLGNQL